MKTPEQIAAEVASGGVMPTSRPALRNWLVAAIKADRAQISEILDLSDEYLGEFNEWGDVARVTKLREALSE
jgi:hypothetical protein